VRVLEKRWSLSLGAPYEKASYSWVAPARLADGVAAVLKLGMPHLEGEHEVDGLRFWGGDAAVRVLEADRELGAMLLEHCEPGTGLWKLPMTQQDTVLATLLKRLWRKPALPHPFRHLSEMIGVWRRRTLADSAQWPDPGLVHDGLRLLAELCESASTEALLATDLHAGNVLRARREPWLAIEPRPFIGDPAYDATQHLINDKARLSVDPFGTIRRFSEAAELDAERVRLWTFARAAAQPRDSWAEDSLTQIARAIAP
jgi:streptomycin 6-kinase